MPKPVHLRLVLKIETKIAHGKFIEIDLIYRDCTWKIASRSCSLDLEYPNKNDDENFENIYKHGKIAQFIRDSFLNKLLYVYCDIDKHIW